MYVCDNSGNISKFVDFQSADFGGFFCVTLGLTNHLLLLLCSTSTVLVFLQDECISQKSKQ